MVRSVVNWFRHGGSPASRPGALFAAGSSVEAVVLRFMLPLVVVGFVAKTLTSAPHPSLTASSAGLLAAMVAFALILVAIAVAIGASMATPDTRCDPEVRRRARVWTIVLVLALAGATAALAALQPNGAWQFGPPLIACFAAIGLERTSATVTFALAAVTMVVAAAIDGSDVGVSVRVSLFSAVPWFVVFRLVRELRGQRDVLEASQVAEARAAAAAERGRLVREMHDVLAHSLSALALQLETTRLLARDRGVDEQVARAMDKAHDLAANGLQEARRAIAAERGDEVPGPEGIGVLAESFREQSGLAIDMEVRGEAHELAPDARLAVYRTAQEALTNIRRHATPERVEVKLDYLPGRTVLVVEDHAAAGAPPPSGLGLSGGGYGLTGMRERAELLGGRLLAGPTTDGFRVELWLPVQPPVPTGAAR